MGNEIHGLYEGQGITKKTYDHLKPEEQARAKVGNELQAALNGKSIISSVTINGKEYDINDERQKFKLMNYLENNGYSEDEAFDIINNLTPDKANEIQTKLNAHEDAIKSKELGKSESRYDSKLLLDKDRYAKIDNFEKMEHLPEKSEFFNDIQKSYPKEEFPDLYKKDGSLNEKKMWKQAENDLVCDTFYGKASKDRINELVNQGMSEADAKKIVQSQNTQILKVENRAKQKENQGANLSDDEKKILASRDAAHDIVKNTKQLTKNYEKAIKNVNNAIDKMNDWSWDKDLNKDQKEKIRNAVMIYSEDQATAVYGKENVTEEQKKEFYNKMFDENGNVPDKNKNLFYQFIADTVVGTDGQVNKSAKKGGVLENFAGMLGLMDVEHKEFTEKSVAKKLGLYKKDIEKMGFKWENQISWGKVILDGLPPAALGAGFGALLSQSKSAFDTDTATAKAEIKEYTIKDKHGYSDSVDYLQNGELVMKIPVNGFVDCIHKVPGAIATDTKTATASANVSVSAVLPGMALAAMSGSLNSIVKQGITGNEVDIFGDNINQVLETKLTELKNGDDFAKACGLDEQSSNYKLARDITNYYFDDQGNFHKTEFLTDWKYNGGYDSKYLNSEEGAVWFNQLEKTGGIKSRKITPSNNQVTINQTTVAPEQVVINSLTANDKGGDARRGVIAGHNPNTTFDYAEGLKGDVIVDNDGKIIRSFDDSNEYKEMHEYQYSFATPVEIEQYKKSGKLPSNLPADAKIFKLDDVWNRKTGESIKANHLELYIRVPVENPEEYDGQFKVNKFTLIQLPGMAGYNQSAIVNDHTINRKIDKLNGRKY